MTRIWSALGRDPLTPACVLAVVTPLVVAVWMAASGEWIPVGDSGVEALRVRDVFSTDPPLVGPYSITARFVGGSPWHPGPMLFQVLAPFYLLSGWAPEGLLVGAAVVNVGSAVLVVAATRLVGGNRFMVVSAVGLWAMLWALRGEPLRDIWNPHLAILPATAFLFAAAAAASGRPAFLPWTVLCGTFAAHSHVSYVGIAGLVTAASFVATWLTSARDRRWVRCAVAAVGLGIVLWAMPLGEQLFGDGNLLKSLTERRAGQERTGLADGSLDALAALGRFEFTTRVVPGDWPKHWTEGRVPTARWLLGLGMVAGALLLAATPRNRRSETAVMAVVSVTVASTAVTLAWVPRGASEFHNFYFLYPVSLFLTAVLGWLVSERVAERLPKEGPEWLRKALPPLVAMSMVVLAGIGTRQPPMWYDREYLRMGEISALAERTAARLGPRTEPVLLSSEGVPFFPVESGLAVELERRGIPVLWKDDPSGNIWGPHRSWPDTPAGEHLRIVEGKDAAGLGPDEGELVAFVRFNSGPEALGALLERRLDDAPVKIEPSVARQLANDISSGDPGPGGPLGLGVDLFADASSARAIRTDLARGVEPEVAVARHLSSASDFGNAGLYVMFVRGWLRSPAIDDTLRYEVDRLARFNNYDDSPDSGIAVWRVPLPAPAG